MFDTLPITMYQRSTFGGQGGAQAWGQSSPRQSKIIQNDNYPPF